MVNHLAKKVKSKKIQYFLNKNSTIQSTKNPDGYGDGSKLHDGTKLHEDNFAPRVYSSRVTVLRGGSFFTRVKKNKKKFTDRGLRLGVTVIVKIEIKR